MLRSPKKVCSRIGIALLAMLLVWLASSVILAALVQAFLPEFYESGWGVWLLNDVPLYFLGMPVFLLIIKGIPEGTEPERQKEKLNVGKFVLILLVCFGATYLLNFFTMAIIFVFNTLRDSNYVSGLDSLVETGGMLQSVLFGAVVPALGEEFIFRYMLRRKMKGCGDRTYILFSALCFAMFHTNFAQIFYAFAIGVVFAYVYLRTGSIWYSVTLHFLLNLVGLAIVPMIYESEHIELASLGLLVWMVGTIALAVVVFCVYLKRVLATLRPPTEPGWSFKAAAPVPAQGSYFYGQTGYTAPPLSYGWQMPYGQQARPGGYDAYGRPVAYPQPNYGWPYGQQTQAGGYGAYGWQPGNGQYGRPVGYPAPQPHPGWQPGSTPASYPGGGAYGQGAAPGPYGQGTSPQNYPGQYPPPPGPYPAVPPNAYAPPPAPYGKRPGAGAVCLGNVGMILYLVFVGFFTIVTLFLS